MKESLQNHYKTLIDTSELGKLSDYDSAYNPSRLYAIPRYEKRKEIGVDPEKLPFYGFDCWNHYEVSWLNNKGKPQVAIAEIIYDCRSLKIIESKSLKLYFNSLNNSKFNAITKLEAIIQKDLQDQVQAPVNISIRPLEKSQDLNIQSSFIGESLDELDIECSVYQVEPNFLFVEDALVEEILYSNLLKSNCLVTNQPDWGSVQISYKGAQINREGLLKYLISFRNHNEFHEQCIERIFVDIMQFCKPSSLSVYGRYTRRGGLDINPYRSTEPFLNDIKNLRLIRQ